MKYFFILGKNKEISAAEILSIAPKNSTFELILNEILLLQTDEELEFSDFFKKLGGSVKGGLIVSEEKPGYWPSASEMADLFASEAGDGKFQFGFSLYGFNRNIKRWAMEIKSLLKDKNLSSRWVSAKSNELSSVVVRTNNLDSQRGVEVCFFQTKDKMFVGLTRQAQEFKKWSGRDYGRPARDDLSGMLPPKLARIMLNLAGAAPGKSLLDPFCGSGTVLSEAMMLGVRRLNGSDASAKALSDTRQNLQWLARILEINNLDIRLEEKDARQVSKVFDKESFEVMAFEPYLGPARGKVDYHKEASKLGTLYEQALAELYRVAAPDCKLVMVVPVFLPESKSIEVEMDSGKWQSLFPDFKKIKGMDSDASLIYGRPGQKIWRKLQILQK